MSASSSSYSSSFSSSSSSCVLALAKLRIIVSVDGAEPPRTESPGMRQAKPRSEGIHISGFTGLSRPCIARIHAKHFSADSHPRLRAPSSWHPLASYDASAPAICLPSPPPPPQIWEYSLTP